MSDRVRRRAAAAALALVLPAGAGLLASNSSLLALTADGGLPVGGGTEPGVGLGTGFDIPCCIEIPGDIPEPPLVDPVLFIRPTPPDVVQAKADAQKALLNPFCNVFITGARNDEEYRQRQNAGTDAASILAQVEVGDAGKTSEFGETVIADASRASDAPRRTSGQDAGVDGVITVFTPFHALIFAGTFRDVFVRPEVQVERQLPDGTVQNIPFSDVLKAATILHEVGHLTGSNIHVKGDPNTNYNAEILLRCFGFNLLENGGGRGRVERPPTNGPRNTLRQIEELN